MLAESLVVAPLDLLCFTDLPRSYRVTNGCIGTEDSDGFVTGSEAVMLALEDVDAALAAVDDEHAVTDVALVHHYK